MNYSYPVWLFCTLFPILICNVALALPVVTLRNVPAKQEFLNAYTPIVRAVTEASLGQ